MVDLDPALLEQDKIRLKKRKRLLIGFILPIIAIILVAFFLLRNGFYDIVMGTDVKTGKFGLSSQLGEMQKIGNIIDPYLPYYNGGYIKLAEAETYEDLESAENDFRESLKYNPPESKLCSIYGNLSYAIELQADLRVSEKNYDDALVLYNKASGILYTSGCASRDKDKKGADAMSDSARDRIDSKRKKAVAKANSEEADGEDGQGGSEETKVTDEDIEAIKQLQKDVIENAPSRIVVQKKWRDGAKPVDYGEPNF